MVFVQRSCALTAAGPRRIRTSLPIPRPPIAYCIACATGNHRARLVWTRDVEGTGLLLRLLGLELRPQRRVAQRLLDLPQQVGVAAAVLGDRGGVAPVQARDLVQAGVDGRQGPVDRGGVLAVNRGLTTEGTAGDEYCFLDALGGLLGGLSSRSA